MTVALCDAGGREHTGRLEAGAGAFAAGSEWRGELLLDSRLAGGCTALRVWHDGEGYSNSWRLDSITVQEARTGSDKGEGCWQVAARGGRGGVVQVLVFIAGLGGCSTMSQPWVAHCPTVQCMFE